MATIQEFPDTEPSVAIKEFPDSEDSSQPAAAALAPKIPTVPQLPVAGLGKQIWQGLTKSVPFSQMQKDVTAPLPWIKPIASKEIKPDDSTASAVGKEAYNLAVSIPNFIATPAGVATTMTGGTGGTIAKGIASLFSAQAWQNAGKDILNLIPNWHKLSNPEKAKALVDIGGNTAFGALIAKGATPTVKPFEEPPIAGASLKMPEGELPPVDRPGPYSLATEPPKELLSPSEPAKPETVNPPAVAAPTIPPATAASKGQDWGRLYSLEHQDLLDAQRRLEQAKEDGDSSATETVKTERDDILQRLDTFDSLSKRDTTDVADEFSNPTIAALRNNPKLNLSDAIFEGQRLSQQKIEDSAYDAALELGASKKQAIAASKIPTKLTPAAGAVSIDLTNPDKPALLQQLKALENPTPEQAKVRDDLQAKSDNVWGDLKPKAKPQFSEKVKGFSDKELARRLAALKQFSEMKQQSGEPIPDESRNALVEIYREARKRNLTPINPELEKIINPNKGANLPEKKVETTQSFTLWSSSTPESGKANYFSDKKDDADAYGQGRESKQYQVTVKNPFDPSTSPDKSLVSLFDAAGGIYEAPQNPMFIRALKAKGYDSVIGGEKGHGGESKWVVTFDKPTAPAQEGVKEPWQMTKAEYDKTLGGRHDNMTGEPFFPEGWETTEANISKWEHLVKEHNRLLKAKFPTSRSILDWEGKGGIHKGLIEQALSEGKPVPPEVLADYPDLKPSPSVVKPEGKPLRASDKSVRDLPVAGNRKGDVITIAPRGSPEKLTFSASDLASKTEWERKELLDKQTSHWDEQPGGAGQAARLRDSVRSVMRQLVEPKQSLQDRIDANKKSSAASPNLEPPKPGETGESKIQGMGGAIPEEFENNPNTPTGIKNATVDAERAKRGLPPAMKPARRSFGEVWDRAMAKIDQDPEWTTRLVDELRDKPRALTDLEDAALLHRQIELQNDYGKMTRDLAQAYDDSLDYPNRVEQVDELKVRTAALADKLYDLYNIGKRVGTETARGLNARKMMAYEDYSLAKMELEKRAANGGKPLTDSQRAEIQALHDRINGLQKQYDDYVSKSNAKVAELETRRAIDEIYRKANPPVEPHIRIIADKVKSYFDGRAAKALKELTSGSFANPIPQLIDLGVSKILSGAADKVRWLDEMRQTLSEKFHPYLDEVWQKSHDALDKYLNKMVSPQNKPKVARAVKDMSPAERIESVSGQIGRKIASGKRNEITNAVQRLARAIVEDGVSDRNELIDRVHSILNQFDPEFTRREAMDAISGYGDFKQLSKDEISVQLRDLKGQMQQLAKLEDMQEGHPPLKTGVERRAISPEESRLIKQVNDAKRKFQIPIDDPNTQLRSSLDELKKRMQSRIEDLNERLANRDFTTKKREPIKLDDAASKLKVELQRAKQKYMRGLIEDRLKNRPSWVKIQDGFLRWYRGGILSSPVVFAKLTAAAIVRAGLTPLEEVVGAGIRKVIPSIAAKATYESGWNTKAEVKSIMAQLTKGPKTAWQVLTTGEQDIDVLYGKGREGAIGEMQVRPFSVADLPGRAHAAMKASTKQAEFERRLEIGLTNKARRGVDISSPSVQLETAVEAYKYANRSIFLQDNRVVSAYNRALRALEEPSKTTGKPLIGAKTVATVGRTLIPIVRVPSNIVAEALQFATGSVTGSARAAMAFKRGVAELPEEQADLIMRELKKGSIGGAVMLAGYFLPNVWGGYYQAGEKRKPSDIKASQARIPGTKLPTSIGGPDIPQSLLHHPIFEAAQAGATVRRIADKNQKEGSLAIPMGLKAASLGLVEESPFVREMLDTAKAFNPSQQNAYFGELAKSITEPQLVQWLAKQQDVDSSGQTIQRTPKTFVQHLESGIPYLRKNVPKKK